MKAVEGAFNQEKALEEALEGAFSVIVRTDVSFAALIETFELLEQETLNTEVVNTIANYLFYF